MEARRGSVGNGSPSLVLLGYPYTPTPHTGRGIDHYLYYLVQGYRGRNLPLTVLQNGRFPDHIQQLLLGEPQILGQVARRRGGFWHAVSPVGARVAVLLGRHPLVTTVHDVMPFYMIRRHPARYRFLRFCIETACRGSDRIIVTFPSVRQFLTEHLGVPEQRISLVPVGFDPTYFDVPASPGPPSPLETREDRVLFFGSWNPIDRGGDLALRAMVHVLRERPTARLLMSCAGPETEKLRRLARDLGLERAVTFLGFVPGEQLGTAFRSASAAVFPSRLGFGIQEMHAMYSGVPLVVTDVRDQSYFVGDDGLICPPDDPEALGRQLARLLADPRLQAELSRRGRIRAQEFSSERMVEQTLRVYSAAGWTG
ncbi:MAG TPA: glycosyltransferase family 4 protein [Thermoplasmata archaeon]|nr:glycosyltransferase family 4 protein [Thermoplasmata archaeon]